MPRHSRPKRRSLERKKNLLPRRDFSLLLLKIRFAVKE
jgi:hypothetical protein